MNILFKRFKVICQLIRLPIHDDQYVRENGTE